MKIGIFLTVGKIAKGGGVERQFLNLVLNSTSNVKYKVFTDSKSKENIIELYPNLKNSISSFPLVQNRFSIYIAAAVLLFKIIFFRPSIIHIPNYNAYFRKLYEIIAKVFPVTLNVIDCRYGVNHGHERYESLNGFVAQNDLKGVYTWYQNTKSIISELNSNIIILAADCCFTDTRLFKPLKKEKRIVFCARFSEEKRPLDFVEAVRNISIKEPNVYNEYSFEMYGGGELEDDVKTAIYAARLDEKIVVSFDPFMQNILNNSSIFVSCQMYENFTSLSMLEAMSSGNAIVAYNVGQTDYFLQDGVNGFVALKETPEYLADAIIRCCHDEDRLNNMQRKSCEIVKEQFTRETFESEFISFLESCIKN